MKTRFSLRNRYLFLGDLFVITVSVFASFALRLELGGLFFYYLPQATWTLAIAILIKPVVFYNLGLYRRFWAYASTSELKLITIAVSLASTLVAVSVFIFTSIQTSLGVFPGFPRSVIAIDFLLTLLLVGGLRFTTRLIAESQSVSETRTGRARRALIVGAGSAGNLVVRELQKNPQLNLVPVAFLDDDAEKQKNQIHGLPVEGRLVDLPRVVEAKQIDEVIIAIPSAPGAVIRRVSDACRLQGIRSRTMPGIYELIGGIINVSRLREVEISDLLRRPPAKIDTNLVGTTFIGKRVLVTGAGGSIGRELCRQIARWGPSNLFLLGHGENSIFETLIELEKIHPSLPIHPVICDIRDSNRMYTVFERCQPDIVFHAAAHKHVPLMEANIEEAITNNILGTRNVLDMALSFGVNRLVMISSDKAVRPTSVMGATKRIAEYLVLDAAHRSGLAFSVVRFGNVLGSRGSIVPRFKRQIEMGGPVTVTHPEMRRFFMTIPEAVYLVLQAAAMGQGGEMFILNMGEQIKILDLAEDLIRLSGLEPNKDIKIIYTGIRPGEKLSEELWESRSDCKPTAHPEILRLSRDEIIHGRALTEYVGELIYLAREGDTSAILNLLDEVIPGATVSSTPPNTLEDWG